MRAFIFAVVGLLIMSSQAFAGWYHVENFEGFVGEKAVHLSIQSYDSFGSGITLQGSYYFDGVRIPIPLYGNMKDDRVRLCEIVNDQEFQKILIIGSKAPLQTVNCPFTLMINETGATGTRADGNVIQSVNLEKVAMLDDTNGLAVSGKVEIPFWAQTSAHMFLGIYEKAASGICMTKLRVINKSSGKVDQEIRLENDPCDAGMVMTPIYMNVEKFSEDSTVGIAINFRDGGMGYAESYSFDAGTKTFIKGK